MYLIGWSVKLHHYLKMWLDGGIIRSRLWEWTANFLELNFVHIVAWRQWSVTRPVRNVNTKFNFEWPLSLMGFPIDVTSINWTKHIPNMAFWGSLLSWSIDQMCAFLPKTWPEVWLLIIEIFYIFLKLS